MVTVGSILSGTFGFVRDNIRAVLVWSGLLTVISLLSMVGMQPVYQAQLAQAQADPAVRSFPHPGIFVLLMLVFLVVFLVQFAAVFRAVLFPQDSRFAFLRLGMDELRLLGAMAVLGLGGGMAFGICFAVLALIAGLLSAIVGPAVGAVVVVNLLGFVLMLVLFGTSIFCWVRLSLVAPMTILQRKVVIGPAWRATRGHFWRLFGAYLVICLLILLVYLVIGFIQMGPILGDMFHPTDPAAHQRVLAWQAANYGFSVRALLFAVFGGLLYGFSTALQGGMIAVTTAQLLNLRGGQRLSEVFE
jgi:hypothetical protein